MLSFRRKRKKNTHFAPAERAAPAAVEDAARAIRENAVVCSVLDSFGGLVVVLNEQRQIVSMNSEFLRTGCSSVRRSVVVK